MAVRGSIWKTLGIDPTNEVDDIRRAYARRLKHVHPEDDPEGFQALRQALDKALQIAGDTHASAVKRPTDNARQENFIAASDAPPAHAALQEDLHRLAYSAEPDTRAVRRAFEKLLQSPAMSDLLIHADTEVWMADFLAESPEVVVPLVWSAAAYFGWSEHTLGPHDAKVRVAIARAGGIQPPRIRFSAHDKGDLHPSFYLALIFSGPILLLGFGPLGVRVLLVGIIWVVVAIIWRRRQEEDDLRSRKRNAS